MKTTSDPDDSGSKGKKSQQRSEEFWRLLVFAFGVNALEGLDLFFYPMYYVELSRYFQKPTAEMGWPSSLRLAIFLYFGIFLTAPIKLFGCRPVCMFGGIVAATGMSLSFLVDSIPMLTLTYGVVGGVGLSMLNMSTMIILQRNFHKNRPLANGIAWSGSNFGNIMGPFWVEHLLGTYGWRGGFLLHGALLLQGTVLGTQYSPRRADHSTTKLTLKGFVKDTLDFSLLKNPSFVMFGCAVFLVRGSQFGYLTVLPNSVVFYGGTRNQAAFVTTIMALTVFASRLCVGFLSNQGCFSRILMLSCGAFFGGGAIMSLALPRAHDSFIPAVIAVGLSVGCTIVLMVVVMVDVFGVENVGRATALSFAFQGTAGLVAPPLSGFLFDWTGSYNTTYLTWGGLEFLAGVLILCIYFLEKRKERTPTKSRTMRLELEAHFDDENDVDCPPGKEDAS